MISSRRDLNNIVVITFILLVYPYCRREALHLWNQKLGHKATRSNLITVFKEAGRLDLATNVEKMTGEISTLEVNESSTKPEHPSALSPPTKTDLPVFPAPTKRIVFTKATPSQLLPGTETIDSSMLSKTDNPVGNLVSIEHITLV